MLECVFVCDSGLVCVQERSIQCVCAVLLAKPLGMIQTVPEVDDVSLHGHC